MPKGYSHTTQEIQDHFMKFLDDMINGPFKTKLLAGLGQSHISLGCQQLGQKGEKFQIAALLTKKLISIDGIVYCNSQSDSGLIFGGKVIDINIKPYIMIINRGQQSQIVLGPNRIKFQNESGDFSIQLPEIYNGMHVSETMSNQQSLNIIELFVANSQDNSISYGQGQDLPQNFNQLQYVQLGFSDIIKDLNSIEQKTGTLCALFLQQNLFQSAHCGFNAQNLGFQRQISKTSTSTIAPQIRTTRAQQIREQAAKIKSQQTQNQQPEQNNFTNRNSLNLNNALTPQLNRVSTFTAQNNINLNNNQIQPNNFASLKTCFNFGNKQNENSNPNTNTGQFQFNQNTNNFKAPNQGSQTIIWPSLKSAQTNGNSNLPSSNQSAFSRPPTQTPQVQFIQQQNSQQNFQTFNRPQAQQNSYQPQTSLRPQFNLSQNKNDFQQNQFQQQQQPITIQPTLRFGNNSQNQIQQIQNQQPTQFNFGNQHQQNNEQIKQHLVFSQLSLIDQETLKNYLKELSEHLNQEQIQKVTVLMLTDPVQFYNYYKSAHDQFQQSKEMITSKNNQGQQNIQNNQSKDNSSKRLKEFDDLTLFLLTLPQQLVKNNEVKYQYLIAQVKDGTINPQKLLKKLIIRKRQPINESFKGLIENKQHSDLILQLRNEEFLCHQIVFQSNSDFFKRAIKDSDNINKYQYGSNSNSITKLLVPDWVDHTAFKLFILFMYTGKVGKDGDYSQINNHQIINLLRISNFFFLEYLQEYLIAEIIIPKMTPLSAVLFLKECTTENKHHKQSCINAWEHLKLFSQFYLQKHLPALLRTNPSILYELEISIMRQVIDKSLIFIVDGNKDLESILQFTADTWAEKSITKLFRKSQQSMDSCSAFDYQIVPQMSDFLKQIDVSMDYKCQLIKSQDVVVSSSIVKTRKSSENNQKNELDSTFIQGANPIKDENKNEVDLSNWKPSSNILKDNVSSKDIFDQKEPQLSTQVNLESLKAEFEKNKGASIITKAFDFGRRSWHLKIDIDYENNVSLWLIERGSPLEIQSENQPQIGLSIPIKFSSIIMQFELLDEAFGEYKSLIFYTYSHGANQIIGHHNFINLSQLKDKHELNLRVHMKEFILHSSMTYYISQNFKDYYKQDLKTIEITKKSYAQNKNNLFLNGNNQAKDYEILNLPFYNVYQLLSANDLKVEEENQILGFLFYYTKVQSLTHNQENMKFISNLLAQTLRFYYLSTKKLLSALRDNEFLRQSSIFFQKTVEEFHFRISSQNSLILNIGGTNSKCQQSKINPRKHYDLSQISNQGRKKVSQDQAVIHPFIEELADWLQNSKHNKDGEGFLQQEVKKWQNLYYEEKSKNMALLNQQASYRPRSPQNQDYKRNHRRSLSNDRLFETQDSINFQRPQINVPAFLRARTPPKQTPAFQQQNHDANQRNYACVNNGKHYLNNSYDQSRNIDDNRHLLNNSMKAFNGSFVQADTKVRSNQYADFSVLLQNLERSGQKNKYNNQNKFVPYYRQNKQGGDARGAHSKDTNECLIF